MKIDPYNPQFPFNLKKTAIKSIFSYLGKVSLISKKIQSVFNDVIKDLYPRIYMLDIKNQRIVDKTLPNGNCIIGDLYCESPDKFLMHKTNEINEYYRNRIISKIASDKATLIKKRMTANLLSNSNIKKRYRYDDKGKSNYSGNFIL
jgi:PHP family Zn ribbon phosphoesterase